MRSLIGRYGKESEGLHEITDDFLKRKRDLRLVSFYELKESSIMPLVKRVVGGPLSFMCKHRIGADAK